MAASLSSKMNNWDSPWEECAFTRPQFNCDNCRTSRCPSGLTLDGLREQSPVSCLFPDTSLIDVFVLFGERNTSLTTSHKSKAGNPSIRSPPSNEMISDSVELWDPDVCFFAHPTGWNKCATSEKHDIPTDVDVESLRSPAKSES